MLSGRATFRFSCTITPSAEPVMSEVEVLTGQLLPPMGEGARGRDSFEGFHSHSTGLLRISSDHARLGNRGLSRIVEATHAFYKDCCFAWMGEIFHTIRRCGTIAETEILWGFIKVRHQKAR
jgi:hypothetical protein